MEFNDKVLESKTLYKGFTFNLEIKKLQNDDGLIYEREVISRKDAVAVVAVVNSDVLMVKQFRAPLEAPVLELPAGILDHKDPQETAYRELIEETGHKAKNFELLTKYYSSVGWTDELVYIYKAIDLEEVEPEPEEEEVIEIIKMPLDEAINMAKSGQIVDAKTVVGLLLLDT